MSSTETKFDRLLHLALFLVFCASLTGVNCASSTEQAVMGTLCHYYGTAMKWPPTCSTFGICSWAGVTCDYYGNIIRLDLTKANSDTIIAWRVFHLPNLLHLELYNHNLTTFPVYDSTAYYQNLTGLRIFGNSITGNLDYIGNFTRLKFLSIEAPQLIIPNLLDMTRITGLNNLELRASVGGGSSFLSGLESLSQLERLQVKDIPLNEVIPPEIGNLTLLRSIQLSNCSLKGTLPAEIGNLTRLDTLGLYTNPDIYGTIPVGYSRLTLLSHLTLRATNLYGYLPMNKTITTCVVSPTICIMPSSVLQCTGANRTDDCPPFVEPPSIPSFPASTMASSMNTPEPSNTGTPSLSSSNPASSTPSLSASNMPAEPPTGPHPSMGAPSEPQPSGVLPSEVLPSEVLPSEVLPSEPPASGVPVSTSAPQESQAKSSILPLFLIVFFIGCVIYS